MSRIDILQIIIGVGNLEVRSELIVVHSNKEFHANSLNLTEFVQNVEAVFLFKDIPVIGIVWERFSPPSRVSNNNKSPLTQYFRLLTLIFN